MQYINLTPHAILLMDPATDEVQTEYPPSGEIARIAETKTGETDPDGNPVVAYGQATGLPESDGKTGYIVSLPVALAVRGTRNDIYVSYDQVRNEDAVVIGSRTLARVI